MKKITFPNRPCPKCGKPIHIKTTKHEECGWKRDGHAPAPTAAVKQAKRRKKRRAKAGATKSNAAITLQDIQAVKAVVDKLGAEKVWQLAEVLA